MQTDWRAFLAQSGAEFDEGRLLHFGNPERELRMVLGGNIICDLSHYALLAVSGADSLSFLHSQFVNDVQSLDECHSQLNGYCNPKGRFIANFRIFRRDETIYLRFPAEMTESIVKKLNMYRMRSQVSIEDVSDSFVRIGFSGKSADEKLAEVLDTTPIEVNEVLHHHNLTVIRIPGITPSYELYSDEASIQDVWNRLNVDSAPVGPEAWRLIEILAGIPHIMPETSEKFVPQMLNYQAINGLSLQKGCYPGQEIVARMHYLGKLKKRMYLVRIKCDYRPTIHQELYSSKQDAGGKAGHIVNIEHHPDGDYAALAVIQTDDVQSADIYLDGADGAKLEIAELPYKVELQQ